MKIFYAYPAAIVDVKHVIHKTKDGLSTVRPDIELHLWEENDISGRPLTDPIFEGIAESDIFVADVTSMNFNVTFEIGYAIGLGKRVYLTRDGNITRDRALADKIGIFDTLGFEIYINEQDLSVLFKTFLSDGGIPLRKAINFKSPVYVLQTPQSNSAMIAITARIKKARLGFKGYMPTDESRLSAVKAVDDVSSCLGTVIPLLAIEFGDAEVHNIRAAFVAGLSVGMGKITLILQPGGGPAPLDVRDLVKTFYEPDDIADSIAEFALEITERFQADNPLPLPKGNFLAELSIGDSVAENEFQTLSEYYLRTDQYKRATRGEVNMIVGRKGTGKTALFSQLRNEKRANVGNIVVDLKPEGYQLIRLKEDVLDYLAEGARTHLITALFEYIFYLEICYKLLEKDRDKHKRDARLYQPYRKLMDVYETGSAGEGDFSERLHGLSQKLIKDFKVRFGTEGNQRLTANEVTELVHKRNIRDIRETLSSYLQFKDSVWVLFDNLDKGWSPHGLTTGDVMILRCLIDAARKIQRELQRDGHDFHCVVFVRNDVYQLLVEASADYGKESRTVLDWTDPDLLREMLRRRLVHNSLPVDTPFARVWSQICISHYHGEETSQYLIDRSLMRPRNLIKLLAHCRGFAVGMERARIESVDLEKGLRAYSIDLITEADQELTDILGTDTELIYYFIGEGQEFNQDRIVSILNSAHVPCEKFEQVIQFMLYYSFLGIKTDGENPRYIFDVGYDLKLLNVLAKKAKNLLYVLNPAFYPALNL
ncbi:MAG: hypothetical protein Q8K00_11375 [Syntrophales bacterium]|nr:hypothetical protein [Syntrophales bacterium]